MAAKIKYPVIRTYMKSVYNPGVDRLTDLNIFSDLLLYNTEFM